LFIKQTQRIKRTKRPIKGPALEADEEMDDEEEEEEEQSRAE